MCLIIMAPQGKQIPSEYITNAWDRNSDGAGVAHVKDNIVYISKGIMELEQLKLHLDSLGDDVPRMIHFRFATLGDVTQDNTHPFVLSKAGAAVCHNGPMLHERYQGDDKRSDSRHFAEDVLAHLDSPTIKRLKAVWEGFIEDGNKLAFLFSDGTHMLVNEKLGTWRKGIWLSNTYSVEKQMKYVEPVGGYVSNVYSSLVTIFRTLSHGGIERVTFYPDDINNDYWSYSQAMALEDYLIDKVLADKMDGCTDAFEYTFDGLDTYVNDLMKDYEITQRKSVVIAPRKERFKWTGSSINNIDYPPF